MEYFAITGEIVQRSKITDLSKREQVQLLNDLLNSLGFTEQIYHKGLMTKFDEIWEDLTK